MYFLLAVTKKLKISKESGAFLSKVQNDLNRKVLNLSFLRSFIIRPKILREEEHFHLICDFIDDPQKLRSRPGPGEHNMNNNKDQSSNECRSHKSLFIVDWFLCPSPDECIQMEIAIHCTIDIF